MTNEAQDLAKVKERISALNSELSELLCEQEQLEQEIAKSKTDMPVREKLITEWVEQQPSKFDITVNLNSGFGKEDYNIHVRRDDYGYEYSDLFFVYENMSDSEMKHFLSELTDNLSIIDKLIAQNVYGETVFSNAYIDKLGIRQDNQTKKLFVYIFTDATDMPQDSHLDVRLNKINDNSVYAQASYDEYYVPKCVIQLNDTTDFIIEKYPILLTSKQTIPFNNMVPEIKKLFKDIKNVKAKYIKPVID